MEELMEQLANDDLTEKEMLEIIEKMRYAE